MKKSVLVLLVASFVLGLGTPAFSQAKPPTKAPAPAPAPAASPQEMPKATGPGEKPGTLGILGSWNAADTALGVGAEYYLEPRFLLRGNLVLNLTGWTRTNKSFGPPETTVTNSQSTPQLGVVVTALNETRISDQAKWYWGGQVGLDWAVKDTANSTTKTSGTSFALNLGLVLDVKYEVVPGIAFFLQPAVGLEWVPVNGVTDPSGNSIDGVTTTNGTKVSDLSYSSLSLTTKTSSLGVIFYLN